MIIDFAFWLGSLNLILFEETKWTANETTWSSADYQADIILETSVKK